MSSRPRVGVAGLGRMGLPMARNLARTGLLVGAFNRTRSRGDGLASDFGVPLCETPAELSEMCDVLLTMVADDHASSALYDGDSGLLQGLAPGTVVLEMSTVSIEHVRALGEAVATRGGTLLDAPVSGSVSSAEDAALTIMVGGDAAALDRVRPVVEALGARVFHLGPLGSGAAMKLAVNAVVYGLNEAVSEGLVLAERAGLARHVAYDVFACSAVAAPFVHYRREAFVRPGETPVLFRLELAAKDLRLILDLASKVGYGMPQAELNARVLDEALRAGYGDEDVSAVADYLRRDGRPEGGR